MKGVVVFSIGAEVFHSMWFAVDLLFIADGPILLDDIGRQCGATIAIRNIVAFFIWGHIDDQELLSKYLLGPYTSL